MANFKIFRYPLLIKERHLDTFSHVNNATYLELFEEARWEFLNAHGVDLKSIHETQISPIILEFHVKFLKELRLRESIVIESQMMSFEKKVGVMRQDIFDEQNQLCVQAKMTFGVFDMKTRKLIIPTAEWLSAIGVE